MVKNNLTSRQQSTGQQQESLFSGTVTVYKKLGKFYFYNFFLSPYNSCWVLIIYLVSSLFIFAFVLLIAATNQQIWVSRLQRMGSIFIGLLVYPENLFYVMNSLRNTTVANIATNLPFFARGTGKEISMLEASIIAFVRKIKPRDLFIFEFVTISLLCFLHTAFTLGAISLIFTSGLNKLATHMLSSITGGMIFPSTFSFRSSLIVSFIGYFTFLSPGDYVISIAFAFWNFFEIYVTFAADPHSIVSRVVRTSFLLLCLLKAFYNNFLKFKQLRD